MSRQSLDAAQSESREMLHLQHVHVDSRILLDNLEDAVSQPLGQPDRCFPATLLLGVRTPNAADRSEKVW